MIFLKYQTLPSSLCSVDFSYFQCVVKDDERMSVSDGLIAFLTILISLLVVVLVVGAAWWLMWKVKPRQFPPKCSRFRSHIHILFVDDMQSPIQQVLTYHMCVRLSVAAVFFFSVVPLQIPVHQ